MLTRGKTCLLVLVALLFLAGCPQGGGRGANPAYDKDRHLAALIEVGQVAIRTGDFARALVSLGEAEKLAPNNADVKHYIGRTYYLLKNPEKALEYYRVALTLDPAKTDVHNNLGIVYLEAKEFELARAEFAYCVADLTYGNANKARYNLGLLEETMGRPELAIPYYQDIIGSTDLSTSPDAYFRLAYIAYQRGDNRQAVDYLTVAVRQSPEFAEAFFLLGESFEKLGFKEDAAEAFGRAVQIDPTSIRGVEAQKRVRAIMADYQ
ncbi:MAG: tetratricopeptide repeat protein [Deltaproteobacteria bacterium]|jgi:Tfp pilus assembly protein PilF|nr:tetratricopeptide repeat protein [Deltaproteobacteria bacterium]